MTTIDISQATTSDIRHIRSELRLTAHEVALALSKRVGSLIILQEIADDLAAEASLLRMMSRGRTGHGA